MERNIQCINYKRLIIFAVTFWLLYVNRDIWHTCHLSARKWRREKLLVKQVLAKICNACSLQLQNLWDETRTDCTLIIISHKYKTYWSVLFVFALVQHPTALILSDITSKCSPAAVFLIINMSSISQTTLPNVFMIHLDTEFYISGPPRSLAITTEPKSKNRFCAFANLLC